MLPVLFSIGKLPISSFGVFLGLGLFLGIFLTWRLSRAWDLNEEKILDLILLTFFGGLIFSRLYFVSTHLKLFSDNFLKIIYINKIPGFSFWGALLGGWLSLFYGCRLKKIDFAQIGDIAAVGFLGGLIFSDLGCFFGSCNVGIPSKFFLSVNMVGEVGKRFPTQFLEALLLTWVLLHVWKVAVHFHTRGKILSLSLIYIGIIKLLTEPLRAVHNEGIFFSAILILLGVTFLYKVTKRKPLEDLKSFFEYLGLLVVSSQVRKSAFVALKKSWYNRKTAISWKLRNLKKTLRRKNVRLS